MIGQVDDDGVVKIEDRRKVSLRFKAIRMIDYMVALMYCDAVKLQMQKQGFSVEKEDIETAEKATKSKLVERHLQGKTTKELSGVISTLKNLIDNLKKDMTALTLNMPEVRPHGQPDTGFEFEPGTEPDHGGAGEDSRES